ncbi:MAG: hypothetical protein LC672_05780 [Acidobacteria bacterium]|nr:hypothetical protein [Acidobacteriota bacterium]
MATRNVLRFYLLRRLARCGVCWKTHMAEVVRNFVSKIVILPRVDERGRRRTHAQMRLSISPLLHNWNDPASSISLT